MRCIVNLKAGHIIEKGWGKEFDNDYPSVFQKEVTNDPDI